MKAKKKFQATVPAAATTLALPESFYENDSADIQLLEAVKRPKEYSWATSITNQTVAVNNNHIYMNMPVSSVNHHLKFSNAIL